MSKFKIEIQITIIAIIIGAAVITTGYFAYKSLSKIVHTIHRETLPDYRIFIMKDVANELVALENSVRLYSLTNNKEDLKFYDTLQNSIINNVQYLSEISVINQEDKILTDSLVELSGQKLKLWQDVLNLHFSEKKTEPAFTELYSKLDERKTDTLTVEVQAEKKGFLRKIFGKKNVIIDTTIVERPIEKDSILQDIQNLESEMVEEDRRLNQRESQLIAKNIIISKKINQLIDEAEKRQTIALLEKTEDADRLAELTYKRLAIFTITAIFLLLLALFVFFNYLKKSRSYQRALQKAKAEAENLAKAKEQFASNVSHEMRTPVNSIYGLAEQLLQQKTDKNVNQQISVIARSASHLKNIINDTLDFSKIQAKKLKIDSIHFSPDDVFSEVMKLQKNEASKKGISLHFDVEEELPEALIGDPLRLKQILINLISNAIKFTEQGMVTLSVKAIRKKYLMYHLEMTISDTGIGIPKENLKSVFDEFVQVENRNGKKYSGTGLGLSIVKKLVELQKGFIEINSEHGQGTNVKITIPFAEGRKENIKEPYFETVIVPESFQSLRVLVADDEEFNLFLLSAIFKKWGIIYNEVSNGKEAVEALKKDDFDIVLMDIRMPGKNGIEATKEILALKPKTNIVAVTATNEKTDQKMCMDAGMKGFLLKPFSEKELFEKIISILKIDAKPVLDKNRTKVNMDEAMHLANGDEAFLKEMIQLFMKSTNKGLNDIKDALVKKDREAIAEICHKMAAPCKHFRANDLYNTIKQLENSAKNKLGWNKISEQLVRLETEINEVNKFFSSY